MGHTSALITGASSGIGAAFARRLPRRTRLVLTGRNAERLATLRAELETPDRAVETVAADLATDAGRDAVLERAQAAEIDLFVCNAGLGLFGRMVDNSPEAEREMVEVNVVATVVLTRALLPGMIERAGAATSRAGLIVLASVAGFMTLPYFATYGASKAFDLHYAESLAAEFGDEPVDVLALCPGPVRTAFGDRAGIPAWIYRRAVPADEVAREGLSALGRKTVHVFGATNRLNTLVPRFLPRRLVAHGTARVMRRIWQST